MSNIEVTLSTCANTSIKKELEVYSLGKRQELEPAIEVSVSLPSLLHIKALL